MIQSWVLVISGIQDEIIDIGLGICPEINLIVDIKVEISE
jgi:hypothetical protein